MPSGDTFPVRFIIGTCWGRCQQATWFPARDLTLKSVDVLSRKLPPTNWTNDVPHDQLTVDVHAHHPRVLVSLRYTGVGPSVARNCFPDGTRRPLPANDAWHVVPPKTPPGKTVTTCMQT